MKKISKFLCIFVLSFLSLIVASCTKQKINFVLKSEEEATILINEKYQLKYEINDEAIIKITINGGTFNEKTGEFYSSKVGTFEINIKIVLNKLEQTQKITINVENERPNFKLNSEKEKTIKVGDKYELLYEQSANTKVDISIDGGVYDETTRTFESSLPGEYIITIIASLNEERITEKIKINVTDSEPTLKVISDENYEMLVGDIYKLIFEVSERTEIVISTSGLEMDKTNNTFKATSKGDYEIELKAIKNNQELIKIIHLTVKELSFEQLNEQILRTNQINEIDYSEESYAEVKEKLLVAQDIKNNKILEQKDIDLVTNELKNAIDNLVIKEVEKAIISDNENIITYNNIQYLKEEHYNYNYVLETIKELNLDSEILFNSQYKAKIQIILDKIDEILSEEVIIENTVFMRDAYELELAEGDFHIQLEFNNKGSLSGVESDDHNWAVELNSSGWFAFNSWKAWGGNGWGDNVESSITWFLGGNGYDFAFAKAMKDADVKLDIIRSNGTFYIKGAYHTNVLPSDAPKEAADSTINYQSDENLYDGFLTFRLGSEHAKLDVKSVKLLKGKLARLNAEEIEILESEVNVDNSQGKAVESKYLYFENDFSLQYKIQNFGGDEMNGWHNLLVYFHKIINRETLETEQSASLEIVPNNYSFGEWTINNFYYYTTWFYSKVDNTEKGFKDSMKDVDVTINIRRSNGVLAVKMEFESNSIPGAIARVTCYSNSEYEGPIAVRITGEYSTQKITSIILKNGSLIEN